MANSSEPADLIVLVPDRNTEATVKAILSRPASLGIRPVQCFVVPHPERDPGCRIHGPEFLSPLCDQYRHALLLFDHEGSGEKATCTELEIVLDERLRKSWGDRAGSVVLAPELEVWLWSNSPHVEDGLGWKGRTPNLRDWLTTNGHWKPGTSKPDRPKESVEKALRVARKPRSSAIYKQIAERVSFDRCTDPAFERFRTLLRGWFPAS